MAREAISVLQYPDNGIDLVVSDLNMPEIDGLQLVSFMRMACPHIPVVLTAHGSEDLAVEALELGAASYVAKKNLADKLTETVRHVLTMSFANRGYERLSSFTTAADLEFQIPNDDSLFRHLIEMVRQIGASMGLWTASEELRLAMALEEALNHAMYRGNLELTGEQTQDWRMNTPDTQELIAERLANPMYSHRKVVVRVKMQPNEARFLVRDGGVGFDVSLLPSADDKQAVLDERHRGIVLMRAFMDEVSFNENGTEITMVKRSNRGSHAKAGPNGSNRHEEDDVSPYGF